MPPIYSESSENNLFIIFSIFGNKEFHFLVLKIKTELQTYFLFEYSFLLTMKIRNGESKEACFSFLSDLVRPKNEVKVNTFPFPINSTLNN